MPTVISNSNQSPKFTQIENYMFCIDEIYTNTNGYNYKIIEIRFGDEMVLERTTDGERVQAFRLRLFDVFENNQTTRKISWARGIY